MTKIRYKAIKLKLESMGFCLFIIVFSYYQASLGEFLYFIKYKNKKQKGEAHGA